MTLTRREFIKHSGIAAGALVVTSAAPLPAWAEEKGGKILTAGRWGAMNVAVKDGKIVSSTGALAKTIPNSLQSTAADQVHTTARIQHPMVRKSYLDNPLLTQVRQLLTTRFQFIVKIDYRVSALCVLFRHVGSS